MTAYPEFPDDLPMAPAQELINSTFGGDDARSLSRTNHHTSSRYFTLRITREEFDGMSRRVSENVLARKARQQARD